MYHYFFPATYEKLKFQWNYYFRHFLYSIHFSVRTDRHIINGNTRHINRQHWHRKWVVLMAGSKGERSIFLFTYDNNHKQATRYLDDQADISKTLLLECYLSFFKKGLKCILKLIIFLSFLIILSWLMQKILMSNQKSTITSSTKHKALTNCLFLARRLTPLWFKLKFWCDLKNVIIFCWKNEQIQNFYLLTGRLIGHNLSW